MNVDIIVFFAAPILPKLVSPGINSWFNPNSDKIERKTMTIKQILDKMHALLH